MYICYKFVFTPISDLPFLSLIFLCRVFCIDHSSCPHTVTPLELGANARGIPCQAVLCLTTVFRSIKLHFEFHMQGLCASICIFKVRHVKGSFSSTVNWIYKRNMFESICIHSFIHLDVCVHTVFLFKHTLY